MSEPDLPNDARAYARAVIDAYVRLPATPGRARRDDRRLAAELHARGVPLAVVETALLLGVVRKARPPSQPSSPQTIRSLHYFLPVIEEILQDPPPEPYIDYLREVMAKSVRECAQLQEGCGELVPARVQKTTFLDER
jgi:hypothetical protein